MIRRGAKTSIPGGRDCLSLSALSGSLTFRVERRFEALALNFTSPVLGLRLMSTATKSLLARDIFRRLNGEAQGN